MTVVYLKRNGLTLVPLAEDDADALGRLPLTTLRANVSAPRNIQHHKKLFALLKLILGNQERYKSTDELLAAVKVHLGHCDTVFMRDGTEIRIPKSISFTAMDQAEFAQFYDRVLDCVCSEIIPGLSRPDVERQLLEFAQ